jgi:Protein of unknown function (DUF1595)/Protein of unknown function (DUF1587)/Protein of unknown function (DUF1592)
MRIVSYRLVFGLILLVPATAQAEVPDSAPRNAAPTAKSPLSPESQRTYETRVKPFLARHCVSCHGNEKTLANFNVETLGTDFLADKTGDNWQEIYANLSNGAMPKRKKLSPREIEEANVVTDWIDQERRRAEQRGKVAPGRVEMRRLNRSEYLNCLRDLFSIEEEKVLAHAEELQQDSTFAGFDKIGASLYIDDALWNNYYELSAKLWDQYLFGPRPKTQRVIAYARDIKYGKNNRDTFEYNCWENFTGRREDAAIDRKAFITVPTGATVYRMRNGGIEYLTAGPGYASTRIGSHTSSRLHDAGGGSWSDGVHKFLSDLMQNKESQPGLYRFKIRAGAFAGRGKHAVDAVKLTYEFGNVGSQDMHSVTIDAPLDQPRDYEWTMYLHPPKVAGARLNTLTWNGTPFISKFPSLSGVVLIDPEIEKLRREILQSISQLTREKEKARLNGDQAKVRELENKLIQENVRRFEEYKKLIQSFADAKRPVQIYNPEIPLDDIPRLWIESWEVEGPIVEWPPQGRKKLFFDGDGDARPLEPKYIREIFARFLPRAYRRPVEAAEVDAVVSWVLKAREEGKLSGLEAVKKGVKAVLCSPDFLFLREPNADAGKSRLLNDYELASRLSFFLWSSMPDDERTCPF